jgi:hypothetical protein
MKFIKPRRLHSANIQAELYSRCQRLGLECYLEYVHERNRFDALIVHQGNIVCIIEVKSYTRDKPANRATKQIDKYSKYGVPVLMLVRMADVDQIINEILGIVGAL